MKICTVATHLRAAIGNFLLHKNSSLFTVTFGEKFLNLHNKEKFPPIVRGCVHENKNCFSRPVKKRVGVGGSVYNCVS